MKSFLKKRNELLKNHVKLIIRHFPLLCLFALTACTTVPRERVFDDFVTVRTEAGDSLSSLAARYLNDPEKDWQISEFNNITTLSPGQELIIPLHPSKRGGLEANGYQTVPILAYCRFSKEKTAESIVAEAAFREQMQFLKENGYRGITLDQLLGFLEFKIQIPEKSVVITFDDGWRSFYDIAFPVLREYGYPATLFVRPEFIGERYAMSWDQVKVLAETGVDIQCKITTRANTTEFRNKEAFKEYFKALKDEVTRSKKIIKKKLNRECRYLAYPYGETHNVVVALAKKEGFCAAFIENRSRNPFFVNNYQVNRSVIHGGFDMAKYKKNLSVFYKSELK